MSTTTATSAPSNGFSSEKHQQQQQTFEFTKRKRWADLLVTELAEAIILILSPSSRKVLYCSPSVHELLGWRDEELIDIDLADFVNDEDKECFKGSFEECLQTRNELLSYARMRCKTHIMAGTELHSGPKEVLFELKGYPHFIPEQDECKCFFVMAKTYPSRNHAMLNTFLELKMENERLQQRVLQLKAHNSHLQPNTKHLPPPSSANTNPYPTATMNPYMQTIETKPTSLVESMNPHYYPGRYDAGGPGPVVRNNFKSGSGVSLVPYGGLQNFGVGGGGGGAVSGSGVSAEELFDEDGMRRKKPKKTHISEQYVCVTCGRTDSPEWRKGPHGAKTLCNACGLRWAKQMRKFEDGADGAGGGGVGTVV